MTQDILVITEDKNTSMQTFQKLKMGKCIINYLNLHEYTKSPSTTHSVLIIDFCTFKDKSLIESLHKAIEQHSLPSLLILSKKQLTQAKKLLLIVDDFHVSPLHKKELEQRIIRIQNSQQRLPSKDLIMHGALCIDLKKMTITLHNKPIMVTLQEFELLKFLASHPGQVFDRQSLLKHVWGLPHLGGTRTVDVHIRYLRSKIETGDEIYIETVHGIGYRFKDNAD